MTPAEVINSVRRLIQDNQLLRTASEYSDATMLEFVNQTLQQVAAIRPDLFAYIADLPTTAGSVAQSMPSDSMRLIEIFSVKGVSAITEVNRDSMDRNYPDWVSEDPGVPINYMRHGRNPNRYFLYPAPVSGVVLQGEYAQVPPTYALNDEIALLPNVFRPAIIYGTTSMVHEIDGQNNSPEKSTRLYQRFEELLGLNLQARALTDYTSSGLAEDKVV